MGGGYYDREVEVPAQEAEYSSKSDEILSKNTSLSKGMDPKRWSEDKLVSTFAHPIIFALDVTGSMGDWSKIIYDKLPMFYGQVLIQQYLTDPAISFCAIGDYTSDTAPLQVTEFGQGKEIDQLISKMFLEGGGGGNYHESYELAAYFYTKRCDLINAEIPFFFVTGDEKFYDDIILLDMLGLSLNDPLDSKAIWKELMQKYNVFHIHKPYPDEAWDATIKQQWYDAIGKDHVLEIDEAKAVIDVILGAIAITSSSRNLQTYITDMEERGQTKERIKQVTKALQLYNSMFSASKVIRKKAVKPPVIGGGGNNNEEEKKEEVKQEEVPISVFLKMIKHTFDKKEKAEVLDASHRKYKDDLRKLRIILKDRIPKDMLCPITGEIFFDPVMTEDGHTYEKIAIECWLKDYDTSPVTKGELKSKNLLPNLMIKKFVDEFYDNNKELLPKP